MKYKAAILLLLNLALTPLPSFAFEAEIPAFLKPAYEMRGDTMIIPVHEVDSPNGLPEDMDYIYTTCSEPILFRGAVNHCELMNKTPEYAFEDFLADYQVTLARTCGSDGDYISEFYNCKYHIYQDLYCLYCDTAIPYIKDVWRNANNIETDINGINPLSTACFIHTQPNQYEDELTYQFLYGTAGHLIKNRQYWSSHSLIMQFLGEKVILLASPSEENAKKLCTESYGLSVLDESIYQCGVYHINPDEPDLGNPRPKFFDTDTALGQIHRAILKPGDVLLIPLGWHHESLYITDSLGAAHFRYPKKSDASNN